MHKLEAEGITPRAVTEEDLARLTAPEEVELIRRLAQFQMELVDAARAYDPARITRYSTDIATLFHKFYNACKVIGDNEPLMQARIALCQAMRITLKNALTVLGITAPESM